MILIATLHQLPAPQVNYSVGQIILVSTYWCTMLMQPVQLEAWEMTRQAGFAKKVGCDLVYLALSAAVALLI